MDAAKSARRTLDRVSYPFLILHSPNDTLAAPRGSRELFTRARSERKAFLMAPFKACSHELHNEVAFEAPLSLAVRWFQGEDFAPLQAFEEPARKSCCVG